MKIISTNNTARIAALRECRYLCEAGDHLLETIIPGVHLASFDPGEPVFWEDEPSRGLYILHSGTVKLYKTSPQGRELILNVLESGDSFNEVTVFDSGKNPVNAAALSASEIWIIEAGLIQDAIHRSPVLAQSIIVNLTANLRMLVSKLEELSFYQVTNRLARLIIELPESKLSGPASQRLTQDEIAAMSGTVREVVARSLRELEQSGAIKLDRGKINILDLQKLHEWTGMP